MATFYLLRSTRDGRLFAQQHRGTHIAVTPCVTLDSLEAFHHLMVFTSRDEAERFIECPKPFHLEDCFALDVVAFEINLPPAKIETIAQIRARAQQWEKVNCETER